ncbi:hypothetical protein NDU88_003291 [Pleurodeles waltl]|uniref:Uncharacterized protein n=1 Tax=Pleurodeles waltl TaxID=8319 RepID=A0AAV7TN91_PLEWA|nr:hypothetical protein NDU88_003291 [Pleurodeles waltl]
MLLGPQPQQNHSRLDEKGSATPEVLLLSEAQRKEEDDASGPASLMWGRLSSRPALVFGCIPMLAVMKVRPDWSSAPAQAGLALSGKKEVKNPDTLAVSRIRPQLLLDALPLWKNADALGNDQNCK